MPLTVVDLAKRRKETTFKWPDPEGAEQEVKLIYNPGWLTGEREPDIDKWGAGTIGEKNANWLASMLISWDLLGEDGQPYPVDFEALYKLDRDFVAAAVGAILQDLYPNRPSAETSDATS